jgi:hypothetical protein
MTVTEKNTLEKLVNIALAGNIKINDQVNNKLNKII